MMDTEETLLQKLARARVAEQRAATDLAVAEYALVIEASLLAERTGPEAPNLTRLRELTKQRTSARDQHLLMMRAHRVLVAQLNLSPPAGEYDA